MIFDQKEIDESKWPRDVRKLLNWLLRMRKRKTVVAYSDMTVNPSWEQTSEQETITLPLHPNGSTKHNSFDLVNASDSEHGIRARIIFGQMNGFYLPTGMSLGDDPPCYVSLAGSGSIWLKVEAGFNTMVLTSVEFDSGATVPNSTTTHGYYSLGTYTVVSGKLTLVNNVKVHNAINTYGAWVWW